jgi:hypothetical protein
MNVVCLEVQDLAYSDNQDQITESTESKVGLNITKVEDSNVYGSSYTTDQLSKAQENDSDLNLIRSCLQIKVEPKDKILFFASPAAKKYVINKEQFFLDENGILWNRSQNSTIRLVVPKKYKQEVMRLNHDLILTGHQGIGRTRARIKSEYYWYKMNEEVKWYVQTCQKCNRFKKATRKAKCPFTNFHADAPMERVHIEFLGPLPETNNGNSNILVMVDQFTKWVEIIPLPSQTAEITAKTVVNEFFTRFGCPFTIHCDQGRNFESQLFKSICSTLGIQKTRTTAYRPSANGQVERFNRPLMDSVRCFVDQSQTDWDNYLPQLASAIRSSVNRMTGMTPNQMILCRAICLPTDLVFKPRKEDKTEDEHEYVTMLKEAIRKTHEFARKKLQTNQEYMKKDYDLNVRKN